MKRYSPLHAMLLAPYLALLLFAGDATFRTHDTGGVVLDFQVLTKIAIWIGALGIGVFYLPRSWRAYFHPAPALLVAFLLWCVLSVGYSANWSVTAGMCVGLLGVAMFVAAMLDTTSRTTVLYAVLITGTGFILISLIVSLMVPELSSIEYMTAAGTLERRLGGIAHPNTLGRIASIVVGLSIIGYARRMVRADVLVVVVIFGIFILVGTESRTAMAAAGGALFLVWLRSRSVAAVAAVTVAIALVISLVVALVLSNSKIIEVVLLGLSRSGSIEEVLTFTGRVHVWLFSIEEILKSPVVGYGYGMTRHMFFASYVGPTGWLPPNAHNLYLELLLTVGIPGLALILALFVTHLVDFVRRPDMAADFLLFYVIAQSLLNSEPFVGVPTGLTVLYFLSIFWRSEQAPGRRRYTLKVRRAADPVQAPAA